MARKLITIWAAAALLWGCTILQLPKSPEQKRMDFVCAELDLDCSDLDYPTVVKTALVPFGTWGLYFHGEPYLFVTANPYMYLMYPGTTEEEIEVHELVHYVTYMLDDVARCNDEELARRIAAKYMGKVYTGGWEGIYNCTNEEVEDEVS